MSNTQAHCPELNSSSSGKRWNKQTSTEAEELAKSRIPISVEYVGVLCLIRGGALTDNKAVQCKPFGTWFQLLFRTRYRICCLVVLSISGGTFYLHHWLASIEPEVQLTQILPERLPYGENIVFVEFGLR